MNTKSRSPIGLLLLGAFLLACAGSAFAQRTITVDFVTVTVSSLNTPIPLNASDTITVRNGGTLFMDANATIGSLTIGDSSTAGTVLFDGSIVQSLTVAGDVTFGPSSGNSLDMTTSTAHTLKVGGNFLASGAGTFRAGSATVEYNKSTAQSITASIGGIGATIQYKNLVLSGNPPTGTAIKNFANGVTVQGTLTISGKAVPSSGSVAYGSLATLVYNGSIAQNTTATEWPAAPTVLNVPVTINNLSGVTLDSDKTIAAVSSPNSLTLLAGTLNDNGKTLTVQGNVLNGFSIATELKGTGKLVLGGTGPQVLTGIGNYGNLVLNNNATSSLPGTAFSPSITQPTIKGRLTIQPGSKVAAPTGTSHQTSFLTYLGADRAAGTYGAVGSGAGTTDNTVFDGSATGILTVNPKPTAVVSQSFTPSTIAYGTPSLTVSGNATPPVGLADYGNGAVPGDVISNVVINSSSVAIQTNLTTVLDSSGAYTLSLTTLGLPVGAYTVVTTYRGGANINAASSTSSNLTVIPRVIGVVPDNKSKTYGDADPALTYTITNSLVGSDAFTGSLSRNSGPDVGSYAITQGTLALNANYTINFDTTKTLTITKKTIAVTLIPATKVYGTLDPPFNRSNIDYTISPQLVAGDTISGTLGRVAGETIGNYALNLGGASGVSAGPNYNLVVVNSANLTITPLAVTVTFDSKNKTYGAADPLFTYTFAPALPFGDTFNTNAVTTRNAGQTVAGSPYTILQGPLNIVPAKSSNYILSFTTTGTLTIDRKAVTVTALSPTKAYGVVVPALVSYSGLINGSANGVTDDGLPATLATLSPAPPVSQCSTQGVYGFTITDPGNDPNYTLTLGSPVSGNVTVTAAPLTVAADNKSKVADGTVFSAGYTATDTGYSSFCGDNRANATAGTLTFSGSAITATNPGVYQIIPSGLTSAKYNITFVLGYLAITTAPATTTNTTDETWAGPAAGGVTNLAFTINKANGTAGANPGWSVRQINGTLTINATSSDQFRLDLVTLAGNAAGLMAKFDPTRPFRWEFARANAISGFDPTKFTINTSLFANKVFNGVFSVSQTGNSLFVNFTPMGSTGGGVVAIPSGYEVGTNFTDATFQLGNIYQSDVDMLWLSPSATSITPQQTVTISINVANLKQFIVGADVYINFDSRFFKANATGAGAPQVAAGGAPWDTVITTLWNVGGDLDTVLAINLQNAGGTSADGTMARLTLTPTATATGKSRVVFRADGGPKADGTGTITNDIVPITIGAAAVLPARVMTDEITVINDTAGPVLNATTMTATQVQPYAGSVNVKNGTAAARTQTVRTSGGISISTTSGPVVIQIPASDAGVGLSGPPILTLTNGANTVVLPGTLTSGTLLNGTFTYNWTVSDTTASGTWGARVSASDTITNPAANITITNAFTLSVNTAEVSGVVEVEQFGGTNRTVTFKTGAGPTNQWDWSLNFISGPLLNAGAFQDRASFVTKVTTPPETVSTYLRYGDVVDLPTLAARLANKQGGVSTYIYGLLYGTITDLPALANTLTNAARSIDAYIIGRLAPGTIVALGAYQNSRTPANAAILTRALLNDFNNIVLGSNIYDPVRFAGVCVSHPTSGPDTIAVNRGLLEDAYVLTCAPYAPNYLPGQLRAQTAQRLSQYAGGADAVLLAGILQDFDTFTRTPAMWPPHNILPFEQGIYNQTVFLGVTLSPTTSTMLQTTQVGDNLTLLNQLLLQDAYPAGQGQYQRAPLTPATVAAPTDTALVTDLNALINGGVSIFTPARFAPFVGGIDPAGELAQLLALPNPTPAQLVRENRLLLELAYDAELSKSVLATYRLVQVPAGVTQVSAKTAWNLGVLQAATFTGGSATVNFVNDGVAGAFSATDRYLRGGDITGDNIVNLADYNVLRINFGGTTGGPADISGDGRVNIIDYNLLKVNFGKSGDTGP